MDASSTAAAWLSALVTTIGLGSLMTQAGAIHNQLDPFNKTRGADHLGVWVSRQPKRAWLEVTKSPPVGPVITGKLSTGFCGNNMVYLTRKPTERIGKATWTAILAVFHPKPTPSAQREGKDEKASQEGFIVVQIEDSNALASHDAGDWESLPTKPLIQHGGTACTSISRTALITLMAMANARPIYRHSGDAGHRAAYASYNGLWTIEWPLGGAAVVRLSPHDSHAAGTDVYPPAFARRVDKCIEMLAGIITNTSPKAITNSHIRSYGGSAEENAEHFKVGFPGRKGPGDWILEFHSRGFGGAHGSRHLYNMMGGIVYEVDMLSRRKMDTGEDMKLKADEHTLSLELPSLEIDHTATLYVPMREQQVIARALDNLPWTTLSWSMHRGMQDILLAYGRPTMNAYRSAFASALVDALKARPQDLEARGWDGTFIRQFMGDMTRSSVMSRGGNSGDLVRVVTDVAILLCNNCAESRLDETIFWRSVIGEDAEGFDVRAEGGLDSDTIIALTKFFVLEWSVEFDYQIYHDFPMELLVG
ncbi:MAG: hypothetical protein M1827_004586 [Pycnora praestabilis]|nr:MAG: hypothetical protein M1827_004586 [Pycnora praestabilis]